MLLTYTCGVLALYRSKWSYLKTILVETSIASVPSTSYLPAPEWSPVRDFNKGLIFEKLYPDSVLSLSEDPGSEIIQDLLKQIFNRYIKVNIDLQNTFDLFEMITAVMMLKEGEGWIMSHRVVSRDYHMFDGRYDYIINFWRDGGSQKYDWEFLIKLFDKDIGQLQETLKLYNEKAKYFLTQPGAEKFPDFFAIYKENRTGRKIT
jgi:hypothetical protein